MKKTFYILSLTSACLIGFILAFGSEILQSGAGSFVANAGGAAAGTFAAIPATCTAGNTYDTTDAPYHLVCVSTNTWNYFVSGLGRVYPPSLTTFTGSNMSSSSISYAQGYGYMSPFPVGSASAFSLRVQHVAIPSFTTNVTLWIVYSAVNNLIAVGNCIGGGEVDDGTQLVTSVQSTNGNAGSSRNVQWTKWVNVTTVSANYNATFGGYLMPYIVEKIVVDHSNLTDYICSDLTNCYQYQQHAVTDFLASATNWGWYASCDLEPQVTELISFQVIPN